MAIRQLGILLQIAQGLGEGLQPEQQFAGLVIRVEWGEAAGQLRGFVTQAQQGWQQAKQRLRAIQAGLDLLQ